MKEELLTLRACRGLTLKGFGPLPNNLYDCTNRALDSRLKITRCIPGMFASSIHGLAMYLGRCSILGLRCSYKRRRVHWGPCLWLAKARRLHSPTGSKHGWAAIHATLQHWQQTVTNLKRRIIIPSAQPHATTPRCRKYDVRLKGEQSIAM